jgi:hypothetical protein
MEHLQDLVARRRGLLALAATSVAVLGTGAAAASGPAPTLLTFPGVAQSFAAAAGRVAWIDSAWALHVRSLRSGAETKILYTDPSKELPSLTSEPRLVLEPNRLLWLSTRSAGMFYDADRVYVAAVGATHGRRVASVVHGEGVDGGYITGVAGDAEGFAYGTVTVSHGTTDPTLYQASGGGVWTLVGSTPRRLPGAGPSYVLAESAGRIAIAPVDTDERKDGTPVAAGTIEIRNATTGALVSSVSPTGTFRAATLTPTTLAVLVGNQVVRYAVPSGRLLGSTAVAADTASALASGGGRIAFRRTRSIGVLDATSGRVSMLMAATGRPTGVAIDGQMLAWAESRRIAPGEASKKTFTTRIRTSALPPARG